MDFDDGGVDHGVFHVWRVRAGLEKRGENVRFDPVAIGALMSKENSPEAAAKRALWYCVYCEDEAT